MYLCDRQNQQKKSNTWTGTSVSNQRIASKTDWLNKLPGALYSLPSPRVGSGPTNQIHARAFADVSGRQIYDTDVSTRQVQLHPRVTMLMSAR